MNKATALEICCGLFLGQGIRFYIDLTWPGNLVWAMIYGLLALGAWLSMRLEN